MRTGSTLTLPVTRSTYDFNNEQIMRRTVEQRFEDARLDMLENRDLKSKPSSLAQRRFQFLLMGA